MADRLVWRPTAEQDRRLERGWRRAQEAIKYNNEPPKEMDHLGVHVATKARDSDDVEEGAHGGTFRKECLAFDKAFVEEILSSE